MGGVLVVYEGLTDRQAAILHFIKQELKNKGYPPSVREIGKAVGLNSSSTVHSHLALLEERGYLRRDPSKPRAIEVTDQSPSPFPQKEMVSVPMIGKITAGLPILAEENVEDIFPIPFDFVKSNVDVFMLTVSGDSMKEAGILDGDYILVERRQTARNGEIVVAMIDNEATVKTFYKEKNLIRLQPENRFYDAIYVKQVDILGKVIGVFRRL